MLDLSSPQNKIYFHAMKTVGILVIFGEIPTENVRYQDLSGTSLHESSWRERGREKFAGVFFPTT
mgnify:CR=1 FL=1